MTQGAPGALSLFWSFWKIPEYGPRQPGPLLRSRGGLPLLAGQGLVHFLSCLPITRLLLAAGRLWQLSARRPQILRHAHLALALRLGPLTGSKALSEAGARSSRIVRRSVARARHGLSALSARICMCARQRRSIVLFADCFAETLACWCYAPKLGMQVLCTIGSR